MSRSSGFGSTPSNFRPIKTRFRYAYLTQLSSLLNVSHWPIIQKVRSHPCLYACGFRFYFTPLPGFFSPFPHGTGTLSVDYEYLALEDGPPIFRQNFSCSALLISILVLCNNFRLQDYHFLWFNFPKDSANYYTKNWKLLPFRSPLLWESRLISFPLTT